MFIICSEFDFLQKTFHQFIQCSFGQHLLVLRLRFLSIFFFFFSAAMVDPFFCEQCTCALFMDPQTPLFINFFIKNWSYSTIHTFKNYFITVFSVFNFQFQQNKFYPNTPLRLIVMSSIKCLNFEFLQSKIIHKNKFMN